MIERIMEIMVDTLRIVNGTYIDGHEEAAQKIVESAATDSQQLKQAIALVRSAANQCFSKEDSDILNTALSLLSQQACV